MESFAKLAPSRGEMAAKPSKLQRNTIRRATREAAVVLAAIGRLRSLKHLVADPDFPLNVHWETDLPMTCEQVARAVPLLIEVQQILKHQLGFEVPAYKR